tara:strand:+ start:825 stop:1070 length:246 start_codon:yes stop_codon:yes gene_type:complete
MQEKFSITEILQAVDTLTNKSIELDQKIDSTLDPQTEKIILQAEEFLNKKQKKNNEKKISKVKEDIYQLNEEIPYLLKDEK